MRKEEDEKATTDCVRGHKGVQMYSFDLIVPWCHN
jgi:hypothetical protein